MARILPGGLRCRRDNPCGYRPLAAATRGEVSGLSIASRRRLIAQLVELDWSAGSAHFVTLTYHENWGEPAAWKSHLRAFQMRLRRRWGSWLRGAIWRLEQQARGAPHYHLVLFWREEPGEQTLRRWVLDNWHAVAEPGSDAHGRVSTRVDRVRQGDGQAGNRRLTNYLAKYLGKRDRWIDRDTGEVVHTGRVWGVWGDPPTADLGTVEFKTVAAYAEFVRRARRHGRHSRYVAALTIRRSGFLIFGGGVELGQLLRGLDVSWRL